jgi:hypothetical protein
VRGQNEDYDNEEGFDDMDDFGAEDEDMGEGGGAEPEDTPAARLAAALATGDTGASGPYRRGQRLLRDEAGKR